MYRRMRPDNKEKGVLLPIFSLPSQYGIGCFSQEARTFIDWLKDTGHSCWQILPLNPTGVADSPYQPLSSFAGNAYFIDPIQLTDQGLISREELDRFDFGSDPERVDYETLYESRMEMLRLAYRRFATQRQAVRSAYDRFSRDNAFWLEDYCIFMALREVYGRERSWDEWPDPLRCRDRAALAEARQAYAEAVDFHHWTQYEFYRQWEDLRVYANEAGVRIIGDMPVYVSYDSADCWANPDQFQLDEDRQMNMIAGVPPDSFSEEGQLWGNPLYDWDRMKKDGYSWWISRIRQSFVLYDMIRLDHFRGYEAYYSCRADAENAIHGIWRPGPGMDLFGRLETCPGIAGTMKTVPAEAAMTGTAPGGTGQPLQDRFIAEDLGFLTEGVKQLLAETDFPGTKVLQFAFDGDPANPYLPENYGENCVVYTGTHDNDTTAGWFRSLTDQAQAGILQYLGYTAEEAWYFILEWDHAQRLAEAADDGREQATRSETNRVEAGWQYVRAAQAVKEAGPTDPARVTAEGLTDSARVTAEGPTDPARVAAEGLTDPARVAAEGLTDPARVAAEGLIAKALESPAKLAIIPLQDYLGLGSEARTNTPGTVVDNWCVRLRTLPR